MGRAGGRAGVTLRRQAAYVEATSMELCCADLDDVHELDDLVEKRQVDHHTRAS